jgi:septal ring factor EnvC (AmiA/AmiB activator)
MVLFKGDFILLIRSKLSKNKPALFLLVIILMSLVTPLVLADSQHQQIKKAIKQVSSSLNVAKSKSRKLSQQVVSLEKKLSDISKSQYHTEKKRQKLEGKLSKTVNEKQQLLGSISLQKEALAQQMQALYTSGEQSHLRLLLKQDNPSDIGRTMKYFEYLNRSRLDKIKIIHSSLDKVKQMEQQIAGNRTKLQNLSRQLSEQKVGLNATLKKREASLRSAKKKVANRSSKLKRLKKQEERLQRVLSNLIDRQKQEEKTKKTQLKRQQKKATNVAEKSVVQDKIKATSKNKIVEPSQFISSRPFSSLRGRLSWPVRGRMIHRYGSQRNAKQRWKGVVIEASGGTKVRAVARGKIEFAGRLNGYGYLVIIRHDKSYRSLYGYNRAIYKKTGQTVNAGEVIAAVGNPGGQAQNALYFEIRRETRLQNPARWCR